MTLVLKRDCPGENRLSPDMPRAAPLVRPVRSSRTGALAISTGYRPIEQSSQLQDLFCQPGSLLNQYQGEKRRELAPIGRHESGQELLVGWREWLYPERLAGS